MGPAVGGAPRAPKPGEQARPSGSSRPIPAPRWRKWALGALWLGVLCTGLVASGYWLSRVEHVPDQQVGLSLAALLAVCGLTLTNLLLRWFRWHFLARRFGVFFHTRRSIRLYFGTLPLLLVPFLLGELFRPLLISRQIPRSRTTVVRVWFLERACDASALAVLWSLGERRLELALVLAAGLVLFAWQTMRLLRTRQLDELAQDSEPLTLALGLALVSILAWSLPAAGLAATLGLLGETAVGLAALRAFAAGTLLGGFSGLPVGAAVTGSTAIMELTQSGIEEQISILSVLVLRLGTVGFACALGALVFLRFRGRVAMGTRATASHFDELAPEYEDEISGHVRERLLDRKVTAMLSRLPRQKPLRGLDIGCGQGWYSIELAKRGVLMSGVDASAGQIEQARRNAGEHAVTADFRATSAVELPFADNSFDFVYAINVLHHVLDANDRRAAFREIVRVLKPGGSFFLHEMNTENPLFRFYMSYLFPLLKRIDQGDERWLLPSRLPAINGALWLDQVDHFTFLPDFLPAPLHRLLQGVERRLERSSRWRKLSAHYVAVLRKHG
ncbi:MAG: methyltransferase domain-containing protein [Proteobacteria bacterium]|nr:methyltransferase domain-containing protein [Pseudomonadota bacterium]